MRKSVIPRPAKLNRLDIKPTVPGPDEDCMGNGEGSGDLTVKNDRGSPHNPGSHLSYTRGGGRLGAAHISHRLPSRLQVSMLNP